MNKPIDWSDLSKLETSYGGEILFAQRRSLSDDRMIVVYRDANDNLAASFFPHNGSGEFMSIREKPLHIERWIFFVINADGDEIPEMRTSEVTAQASRSIRFANGLKCSEIFHLKGEIK